MRNLVFARVFGKRLEVGLIVEVELCVRGGSRRHVVRAYPRRDEGNKIVCSVSESLKNIVVIPFAQGEKGSQCESLSLRYRGHSQKTAIGIYWPASD